MKTSEWQSIDSAPKDGTVIEVQVITLMRWLPYKPTSQQFKRGEKGRWQRHNGYGWENAEYVGMWRLPRAIGDDTQGG